MASALPAFRPAAQGAAGRGGGRGAAQQGEDEFVVEQTIGSFPEVFVYAIPPLSSSGGHRAELWGLDNPVATHCVRLVQRDDVCFVRIFERQQDVGDREPRLFAECPVQWVEGRPLSFYVEQVLDSSRYFVLRMEDRATGRHAFVGIGFRERQAAFDFQATLHDHMKYGQRQAEAHEHEPEPDAPEEPFVPSQQFALQEGQKIHVNVGSGRARSRPKPSGASSGGGLMAPPAPGSVVGGGGGGMLAPPPAPGTVVGAAGAPAAPAAPAPAAVSPAAPAAAPAAAADDDDDDDWGDFVSA